MSEEDATVESNTTSEDQIEEETSILVHSKTAKKTNPTDIYNLLSTIYKKKPNFKTNFNKSSTSAKELVVDGVTYCSVKSQNIVYSPSKVDRV